MPGRRIRYNGRHQCPECKKLTHFYRYFAQLGKGWCEVCGWTDEASK